MDVFVARFPVFNDRKEVFGYELIFRDGFEEYYRYHSQKTEVDFMAFLDYEELTGKRKGMVFFPRELLLTGFPMLFPGKSLVISIPADMAVDDDLLARCRDLKDCGFELMLTGITAGDMESKLFPLVNIVKVASTLNAKELDLLIARCRELAINVLLADLNSQGQFDDALSMGAQYFAGDFFVQPLQCNKGIASNKLITLQVIKETGRSEFCYDTLADLIQQDVGMTYKLLRLVNSAWMCLRHEVKSVRHALVLLGPKEIRRWTSVVALGAAGQDKPRELLLKSLVRAKLAEELALAAGMTVQAPELFLMGMFSMLEALMDRPMEELLNEMALSENIRKCLVNRAGPYCPIYALILAYENAQWVLLSDLAAGVKLQEESLPSLYRKALTWASKALDAGQEEVVQAEMVGMKPQPRLC